jgi:hypothetical protein
MGYEEYKKNALLWYLYFQFSGTRFTGGTVTSYCLL